MRKVKPRAIRTRVVLRMKMLFCQLSCWEVVGVSMAVDTDHIGIYGKAAFSEASWTNEREGRGRGG